MRKSFTGLWSLLLLIAAVTEVSAQQQIDWITDVNQARQMSEQQKRPILLHFYADWCVPCRKLDRDVFPNNAVVKAISDNFIAVKVDIEKSKPLAEHFQVSRIPADVIVTADGQVLYQGQSSMDANVLVSALDGVTQRMGAANNVVANTTATEQANVDPRTASPQLDINRGGSFQGGGNNLASSAQMQINPHVGTTQQPLHPPYANPVQSPAPIEPRMAPNNGNFQPDLTLSPNNNVAINNNVPPQLELPPRQQNPTQQFNNVSVAPAAAPNGSQIALDGFCPVTLIEKSQWVEANPQYGVVHRKRTYLFAGPEEQKKFLQDPDRFSPALSGFDPVRFVEEQRLVEGRREFGVYYDDMIFLFADDQALNHFSQAPAKYVSFVRQAMGTKSTTQR
ncbi:MAG: thiol-disulfide isomerase/thioredoxin [Pirellulaceae bacterium]|jgi:thiol-disulfide isomerase/thioredoxin